MDKFADIRRDYGNLSLDDGFAAADPIEQFQNWFEDVLSINKSDPTAMVLSTTDQQGYPDSRVVLLKGLSEEGFVFYSNYNSAKAQQLALQPKAALNFYWPELSRQVRIRGDVIKTSAELSDNYFSSRPLMSQLSAIISPQSQKIPNRAYLDEQLNLLSMKQGQEPVVRPEYWGGFILHPIDIEFWQGRDNRLHDRIHYVKKAGHWLQHRLAP